MAKTPAQRIVAPRASCRIGAVPAGAAPLTMAQTKTIAQTFLKCQSLGAKVRNVDPFPGLLHCRRARDGKVIGMLSVNAYTGQVWYHGWHGTFIQEKELS